MILSLTQRDATYKQKIISLASSPHAHSVPLTSLALQQTAKLIFATAQIRDPWKLILSKAQAHSEPLLYSTYARACMSQDSAV